MVTTLVLAITLAAVPQQRQRIVPDTAVHVQQIFDGTFDERRAAVRALAALSEAEAVEAVRQLIAAPTRPGWVGGHGGRLGTSCGWDDVRIGLPMAEAYLMDRFWLEDGPPGARRSTDINRIGHSTDPSAIGCWLIERWGPGESLVPELRAMLGPSCPVALRQNVARALGARGQPCAVPDLLALLGDAATSGCAIGALARVGPAADAGVVAMLRMGNATAQGSALWFLARHVERFPGEILVEVAGKLDGEPHRAALTVLVQANARAEGPLLQQLERGGDVTQRAVAGLVLLPGRTGPAFPIMLALARDPHTAPPTRALALRFVAESPSGVGLSGELSRLAEAPGDVVVRTAAARALGRLREGRVVARDVALRILASDAPVNVRVAALQSAVQCDPSIDMRRRVEQLGRDRSPPRELRDEARYLESVTEWCDHGSDLPTVR